MLKVGRVFELEVSFRLRRVFLRVGAWEGFAGRTVISGAYRWEFAGGRIP